jgi:hypothetical protein
MRLEVASAWLVAGLLAAPSCEPGSDCSDETLTRLKGRYLAKGKYESFRGEPVPAEESLDGSLINSFRDDLSDEKTKDGLAKDLFPLTPEERRITSSRCWAAWSKQNATPAILVSAPKIRTKSHGLARRSSTRPSSNPSTSLPSFPAAFLSWPRLGTDLPALGFNLVQERQEQGVWFPARFETEFQIHAQFFVSRDVSIALENADFERTPVTPTMKVVSPAD